MGKDQLGNDWTDSISFTWSPGSQTGDTFVYTPSGTDPVTLSVTATSAAGTDAQGQSATWQVQNSITVSPAGATPTLLPIAAITTPSDSAEVKSQLTILGTATDSLHWTIL